MPTEEMQMPAIGGQQPSYQEFMQPINSYDTMTDNDTLFHCNSEELEAFNKAQGGEILEKDLKIPIFTKLGEIINTNPEIKETLVIALKGYFESKDIQNTNKQLINYVKNDLPKISSMNNKIQLDPELEQIRKLGKGSDKDLAIMPKELLYFIWENMPESISMEQRLNPETGLPQFFIDKLLKGLFTVFGGVVGTMVAPGLGTAIGMGLGSFGGDVVSNAFRDEKDQLSFMEMLGNAALAGGTGYLGGTAWSGGLDALKEVGMVPYLVAGGGYLANSQGQNQRLQKNFQEQENQRLQEHAKRQEMERLEAKEQEKYYLQDRKNAYKEFIHRFRPLYDPSKSGIVKYREPLLDNYGNIKGYMSGIRGK